MLVKTIYPNRTEGAYTVKSWSYQHNAKAKEGQEYTTPRQFYIDLDSCADTDTMLAESCLLNKAEILFEQWTDEEIDSSAIPSCYLYVNKAVKVEL